MHITKKDFLDFKQVRSDINSRLILDSIKNYQLEGFIDFSEIVNV